MNKEFQVIMDEIQKIAVVSPELAEKVASNILGRIGDFVDDLKGVGIAPAVEHRYSRYIDGVKEFGIPKEESIKDIISGAKKGEPLTNDQFILMEIAKRDEALAKVLMGAGIGIGAGAGIAAHNALNNRQEKTAGLVGLLKGDNVAGAAKNKWAARQRASAAREGLYKLDRAPYEQLDEIKLSLNPNLEDYQKAVFELEAAEALLAQEKMKTRLARSGTVGVAGAGAYGAHVLNKGEEKTAGLIDVLTGKAMRNAGKSVVGASDELAGVLDRKAQTLDELRQFQGQIGEAEAGVGVLQDGRLKREALEFARNTAKGQALDAAELAQQQAQKLKGYSVSDRLAGMHTQDKTKYNMLAKGQTEANDMFSDADRAYREYMDELHSKANKPLIDKMTPEYIAEETERFRGSLGGITQEIQQKQDEIKALQKEYGKQKKLKWGARAGVGAGAVGAGALYNRPYTDQSNYDPMMVTAAEADYLEKIANVGAILTGAKAMGKGIASLAGKAGQRAAGYVGNVTGSTVRGLNRTVANSADELAKINKGLGVVDDNLSKAMSEGNLVRADKLQGSQLKLSEKVNDAMNVNREATSALPGARKAMNRARIGTAVGVGGLMAGNAISDSAEDRQEEQQQFYSSPYAQRFS